VPSQVTPVLVCTRFDAAHRPMHSTVTSADVICVCERCITEGASLCAASFDHSTNRGVVNGHPADASSWAADLPASSLHW
jgi:hypothetical protein